WQPRGTTRPGWAGLLPRPAPDVDGDGVRDLVLLYGKEVGKSRRFCRIVSGGSGRPLWSSPEERALSPPAFADADGDGALDLIVIASEVTGYTKPSPLPPPPPEPADASGIRRGYDPPSPKPIWAHTVEALSIASGRRLWHAPLDPDWFRPVKGDDLYVDWGKV